MPSPSEAEGSLADEAVEATPEIEDCPRCGSSVIAMMSDDQFRCFNCDYMWDEGWAGEAPNEGRSE